MILMISLISATLVIFLSGFVLFYHVVRRVALESFPAVRD